jgi:hypothetical protein
LQHELGLVFELKIVSKIILAEVFVDKTVARMIAPISKAVSKKTGMMKLLLRYQGRLVNIIKSSIKNTIKII